MARLNRMRARGVRATGGFTLIETALATIIIGIGVLAMVDAQQAFITSNLWSSHAAGGTFLANEIRELTRNLPRHDPVVGLAVDGAGNLNGWGPDVGEVTVDDFDDIDDFDGIAFAWNGDAGIDNMTLPGPIDAFGEVIPAITLEGDELGGMTADGDGVLQFTGEAMTGWTQTVFVQKVNPFNTGEVLPDDAVGAVGLDYASYGVEDFPLRVTVEVTYQRQGALEAEVVARVVWIVP